MHTGKLIAGTRGTPYEDWDEDKKNRVLTEAIKIIASKTEFISAQIIQRPDFDRFLEDDPDAKQVFPTALVFGLGMVFAWARNHAEKANHEEAYSYTFELGETKEEEIALHEAFADLARNPGLSKEFRAPSNGMAWKPKLGYPPVQAADIVANLSYKEIVRDTYTPMEASHPAFLLLREMVSSKYIHSYGYDGMRTVWKLHCDAQMAAIDGVI